MQVFYAYFIISRDFTLILRAQTPFITIYYV